MSEELDNKKLSHLIDHWVEHNDSHINSFREWAERAKKDGFLEASEDILEAAKKVEEANDLLTKAKDGLFHLD